VWTSSPNGRRFSAGKTNSSGRKRRREAAVAKNDFKFDITAKDRSKQAMRSVQKGLGKTQGTAWY